LYGRIGISFPGIRDAHYYPRGNRYQVPTAFPCIYFDDEGCFIVADSKTLYTSGNFRPLINVNVLPHGSGISSLPGYRKLDPAPQISVTN
jgi:hypothetical protein